MTRNFAEKGLTILSRTLGVCATVGTFGIGAHTTRREFSLGVSILLIAVVMSLLELVWLVDALCRHYGKNTRSFETRCWSITLTITSGWRKGLIYLPLACLLIKELHMLWFSVFNAGLLVILTILHISMSVLDYLASREPNHGMLSLKEDLLNTRSDCYHYFDGSLVTEVPEDYASKQQSGRSNRSR